jgi:hypothetical protein
MKHVELSDREVGLAVTALRHELEAAENKEDRGREPLFPGHAEMRELIRKLEEAEARDVEGV